MNFITFNIVILMIKMSAEQINNGVEIAVLLLTLLNHLFLLDIEIRSSMLIAVIGISIISVVSIFQLFTDQKKIHPRIDFNISL
jgi:hypothetical protein